MADPIPYKRSYSFTNYQADEPAKPLPGNRVDIELDNIAQRSADLTNRVNSIWDVDLNMEAVETVAEEIDKVVYVADNMGEIREIADKVDDIGPRIDQANSMFLGAHAADPTTGPEGAALVVGATYYNTTEQESRVWTGTAWVQVVEVVVDGSPTSFARKFDTRGALANAMAQGLPAGTLVIVYGVLAIIDPAATGARSALHDYGINGVRLLGGDVRALWWTGDNPAGSQSALILAANAYALAVIDQNAGSICLKFEGHIRIGSPVDLGANIDGFSTDFSAAFVEVVPGSILPTQSAITIRGRRTNHFGCTIECNKLSNGWEFRGCTQSVVSGHNSRHQVSRGLWITDSNANASFIALSAYEWFNNEPEFQDWNNFVSDGLYIDGKDCTIIDCSPGYCKRPIYFSPNALHVTLYNPHPYNGNPSSGVTREHPYIIVSDAGYDCYIDSAYLDNGYVLDRTARLHMFNARRFSNAAAMVNNPQVMVQVPAGGASQVRAVYANMRGSVGFSNMNWLDTLGPNEPLVVFAAGQSNMAANADAVGGQHFVNNRVKVWGKNAQGGGSASWITPVYGVSPLQLGGESLAIGFANRLAEMTDRDVYVVLMARGGHNCESFVSGPTRIANGWTATNDVASVMYAEFAAAFAAIPGRTTERADFFIWHQGEANGADNASVYRAKFAAVLNDATSNGIISAARTRMVAGGLLTGVSNRQTVEDAVRAEMAGRARLAWAESDSLGAGNGSSVHFSGQAIMRFSMRYLWAGIEFGNWNYAIGASSDSADNLVTYSGRHTRLSLGDDPITYHEVISGAGSAYIDWQFSAGSTARVRARWSDGSLRVFDPASGGGKIFVGRTGRTGIDSDGLYTRLLGQDRGVRVQQNGHFRPDDADNEQNLGAASLRWAQVYAGNGTINTSDAREKTDVSIEIPSAALDAIDEVPIVTYRWIAAIQDKGEDARTHFGVISQEIRDAFARHGLDAHDFGLFCYDEWEEQPEVLNEDGTVSIPYAPGGNRFGVRMDQVLALKLAAMERKLAALD